jgi:hypothetical protein
MAHAVVAGAVADTDKRHFAGRDPRLQLVALGLGELPGRDGCVDAIGERVPQRRLEVRGVDAELLRRVRDDRVALRFRREPVGRDGGTAAH